MLDPPDRPSASAVYEGELPGTKGLSRCSSAETIERLPSGSSERGVVSRDSSAAPRAVCRLVWETLCSAFFVCSPTLPSARRSRSAINLITWRCQYDGQASTYPTHSSLTRTFFRRVSSAQSKFRRVHCSHGAVPEHRIFCCRHRAQLPMGQCGRGSGGEDGPTHWKRVFGRAVVTVETVESRSCLMSDASEEHDIYSRFRGGNLLSRLR